MHCACDVCSNANKCASADATNLLLLVLIRAYLVQQVLLLMESHVRPPHSCFKLAHLLQQHRFLCQGWRVLGVEAQSLVDVLHRYFQVAAQALKAAKSTCSGDAVTLRRLLLHVGL